VEQTVHEFVVESVTRKGSAGLFAGVVLLDIGVPRGEILWVTCIAAVVDEVDEVEEFGRGRL